MGMYGSGIVLKRPAQFGLLVGGSSFFVSSGALVYVMWTMTYKMRRHMHNSREEQGHSHSHAGLGHAHDGHAHHDHTLQEEEALKSNVDGFHEHLVYEPTTCDVQ